MFSKHLLVLALVVTFRSGFCFPQTKEERFTVAQKAARKNLQAGTREALAKVHEALADLSDWQAGPIHEAIIAVAEAMDLKLGKVAQPVRVAVSGGPVSPPIDITLELLGRDKTMARLDRAIAYIDSQENAEKT